MVVFAIPSRVSLETDDGIRASGYVTHFEGGCIWVYLRGADEPPFRSSVRLVFRRDGEASLGISGVVIWAAQDRVAVEVHHPVDRAIVRQWENGTPADASEFVRLDRTELPTAEFPPVTTSDVATLASGEFPLQATVEPTEPLALPLRATEGWPDTDTLDERPPTLS